MYVCFDNFAFLFSFSILAGGCQWTFVGVKFEGEVRWEKGRGKKNASFPKKNPVSKHKE